MSVDLVSLQFTGRRRRSPRRRPSRRRRRRRRRPTRKRTRLPRRRRSPTRSTFSRPRGFPKELRDCLALTIWAGRSFNLDAWKRFYSNNNTRPDAINYFWDNFDKEGYSMWRADYKYNSELTLVFMSSNLIGGFFQRLEACRKYAFGTLIVFGEDNKNEIHGYFIIRGQEIPEILKEVPDYESYDFTKVDPTDPAVKKNWEDYIAWDGDLEGMTLADGEFSPRAFD